ncbi:hypothetical protein H5T51_07775, partial [Candidatus Bathyarchaeota archaeon]|nr:hypothetical protein [Candidatus Bathyarchaeota archaeon]
KNLPSDEMYLLLLLGKVARVDDFGNAMIVTVPKRGGLFDNLPSIAIKHSVKNLRNMSGLSQSKFSKALGGSISRSFLAEAEIGYHRRVRRSAMTRLLYALPRDIQDNQEAIYLQGLVTGGLAWDEVLEIVDTGREESTYDIEVRPDGKKIENFLGGYGGIFLHNSAIEDRMLCRLHRLTKERFVELARSQMRLALGEIDVGKGAQKIRDHLTLVYAIETEHPLVKGRFPKKPVLLTPEAFEAIEKARNAILEFIPKGSVGFSARLENMVLRFACSASLLNYFSSELDYIPVSDDALKYAVQLYVEEASIRSRETFKPEDVLKKLKL